MEAREQMERRQAAERAAVQAWDHFVGARGRYREARDALREAVIAAIREGITQSQCARLFGISRQRISELLRDGRDEG